MILTAVIVFITYVVGFISGIAAWRLGTNDRIETIKSDAKASLDNVSRDSYAAGYLRAYKDKTARRSMAEKTDTEVISILA